MVILPASPSALVRARTRLPLVTSREPVVMVTFPPLPIVPGCTSLNAPVKSPSFPSNLTQSLVLMVTLPAFPSPKVLTPILAPLVTSRESAVMDTFPALPTASGFITSLNAPLKVNVSLKTLSPSNLTQSLALMVTLPASPSALVSVRS